jgi:hypothetical protein
MHGARRMGATGFGERQACEPVAQIVKPKSCQGPSPPSRESRTTVLLPRDLSVLG